MIDRWRVGQLSLPVTLLLLLSLLLVQCRQDDERTSLRFNPQGREVPVFSADSARHHIETQVGFGPRVPNSEAHQLTRDYLVDQLQAHAGESAVYVQSFQQEGYDGEMLELHNIIAAFNIENRDRILLAAHWDTRPRADEDQDRQDEPILGADDGGSGVGVLLELARLFGEHPPPIGVDIILFDGEDYGRSGEQSLYFLGSRYWSLNQPVPGYSPRFGILLDMVGGRGAIFYKEGYSLRYAPSLVHAVWDLAHELSYGDMFPDEGGSFISDDHLMVNRHTDIPMIDIIHHSRSESGLAVFPPWWHTHEDNLDIIDTETLQAVGSLMAEMIYNRIR